MEHTCQWVSPFAEYITSTRSTDQGKKRPRCFQSQRRRRAKEFHGDVYAGQSCPSQAHMQLSWAGSYEPHRTLLLSPINTLHSSSFLDPVPRVSEPQAPPAEPGSERPTRSWVALPHLSSQDAHQPASTHLPLLLPAQHQHAETEDTCTQQELSARRKM